MNRNKFLKKLGLIAVATIFAFAAFSIVSADPILVYEQSVYDGGTAATSAIDTVNDVDYECADNFYNLSSPIDSIVLYGLTLFHDGSGWIEMTPDSIEPFIVRFYADNGTDPGVEALTTGTYSICLEDSYGDGWNGGVVSVYVNGTLVLNEITLSSGSGPECHTFTANAGQFITTIYVEDDYPEENYYYIKDPSDTIIAEEGVGDAVPGNIGGPNEPDWANPIYEQQLMANVTYNGTIWSGSYSLYRFNMTLNDSVNIQDGWISAQIDADNGSGTWFLWINSLDGDLVSYQRIPTTFGGRDSIDLTKITLGNRDLNGFDLALELWDVFPNSPVVNIDTGEGFNTTQEAIDDPDTLNGHTIQVNEGNFAGAVVNKSLTIQGLGAGITNITSGVHYGGGAPGLETAFLLESGAEGTIIKDFSISCNSSANFYFAIFSRDIDNVTIDSLVVDDAVQGITNYGGSNWAITNNILTDTEAAGGGGIGIYVALRPPNVKTNNNVVQYNTISSSITEPGYTAPGICLGLDTRYGAYDLLTGTEEMTNNVISDNQITGTGNANEVGIETGVIGVSGNATKIAFTMGMIHDNSITANQVDGSDFGIYAYVVDNLLVEENEVTNCVSHGISIWDDFTGSINNNNIYNNAIGLYNDIIGTTIDATCNWWGDISGPYNDTTNPSGLGNSIVGDANIVPWLTDAYPTGTCNGYPGPVYNIDTGELFTTIQAAIDDVDTLNGHTIQVAAITHAEGPQISITKDLTIQGYGCGLTIILPTGDTGSSGDARGWWLVNDGIDLTLKDMKLDGTGFDIYQAIRQKGSGTIDNVCFTEIKYPTYGGVAVAAFGGGPVDVTNCQFSEIGRVGVLYWVTGSLFQGNTYVGKGDGDWLDYCLDIGGGGGVTVIGNNVSGCTGVASSDGSTSAGFLVTTYYGAGTYATIEENNISDCSAAIAVGYDEFDTSSVEAHFNNFINCEEGIFSTAPVVNGTCNWWGDITGPYHAVDNPTALGCNVSDNVTFLPWLNDLFPYGDCIGGLEALDINQSVQDRGFPIRHAADGDWGAAQNFTPTKNTVTRVEIYLRKFGVPEFDLTVELRTGGPEGTLLDTVVFTPAEVPSSWTWVEVDFADQSLPPGTDYFIVCPPAPSGVTTSFGYEWGYAFGNQYDPGSFWFTRDGGNLWRDLPTMYEFVFKTYGA